ncbi:MAG: endolytic transglycosylase MltG, partial [Alphaproteobacteria bacterium]
MRRFFANLVTLVIIVVLAAGGTLVWIGMEFARLGPLTEDKIIAIARGATSGSIAELLAREGIVHSSAILKVKFRIEGADRSLKAGEYRFSAGASIDDVIETLR